MTSDKMAGSVSPEPQGKLSELLGVEPEQTGQLRPLIGDSAARHIERSSGTQAASNVLLATIAVFVVAYFAKLVLVTLLISVVLAFMLEPAVSLLERTRMPRAVATGIVMLIIAILLYLGGAKVYAKTMEFIDELPKYSQKVRKIADEYRD